MSYRFVESLFIALRIFSRIQIKRPSKSASSFNQSVERLLLDDERHEVKEPGVDNPSLSPEDDVVVALQAPVVKSSSPSPLFMPRKSLGELSTSRTSPDDSDSCSSIEMQPTKSPSTETDRKKSIAQSDNGTLTNKITTITLNDDVKSSEEQERQQSLKRNSIGRSSSLMNPLISTLTGKELLDFSTQTIPHKQVWLCILHNSHNLVSSNHSLEACVYKLISSFPLFISPTGDAVFNYSRQARHRSFSLSNVFLASSRLDEHDFLCLNIWKTQHTHTFGYEFFFYATNVCILFSSAIVTQESLSDDTKVSESQHSADSTDMRKQPIPSGKNVFVLCGRRRKKSKTYLIGCDPYEITRERAVVKLKSNVLGTQFNALR